MYQLPPSWADPVEFFMASITGHTVHVARDKGLSIGLCGIRSSRDPTDRWLNNFADERLCVRCVQNAGDYSPLLFELRSDSNESGTMMTDQSSTDPYETLRRITGIIAGVDSLYTETEALRAIGLDPGVISAFERELSKEPPVDRSTPPSVTTTRYFVSVLPINHPDAEMFGLYVEWRGDDRWAVTHIGKCFDKDGNSEYEPSPSNRENDFIERTRFPLNEAVALAERVVKTIVVNGMTAQDFNS